MADIPRLNGAIRALEQGKPAFVTFSPAEINAAQAIAAAPYDAVVFEMEHSPYDVRTLRDCMQYMLDRRQIVQSGTLAAAVAPMVRIPPNGGEMNQWVAKQVLDIGVYGVIWPHVSTVEEARNAVAACRYPRPPNARYFEPAGQRAAIRRRNVLELIEAGGNIYYLAKFAGIFGLSVQDVGAQQTGMPVEAFKQMLLDRGK